MKFELREYHRNTPEDALINDLKRVASLLKKDSVIKSEYKKHGRFYPETLRRRFGSWFEALEKAGLEKTRNLGLTDTELIEDLKRVSGKLKKDAITRVEYEQYGKYSASAYSYRFGTWFKALEKAQMKKTRNLGITDEEYFKNLEEVWIKLGRQPKYVEIQKPFSKYCAGAYEYRFGTWRKALAHFIKYINGEALTKPMEENISTNNNEAPSPPKVIIHKHKTKRTINNRLRVQVLIRDGNKCKICEKTVTGDDIHIDHMFPWSKGGETVLENLQVLCSICNIGKSDL